MFGESRLSEGRPQTLGQRPYLTHAPLTPRHANPQPLTLPLGLVHHAVSSERPESAQHAKGTKSDNVTRFTNITMKLSNTLRHARTRDFRPFPCVPPDEEHSSPTRQWEHHRHLELPGNLPSSLSRKDWSV